MRVGDSVRSTCIARVWSGKVTNIFDTFGEEVDEVDCAKQRYTLVIALDEPLDDGGHDWLRLGPIDPGDFVSARLH